MSIQIKLMRQAASLGTSTEYEAFSCAHLLTRNGKLGWYFWTYSYSLWSKRL